MRGVFLGGASTALTVALCCVMQSLTALCGESALYTILIGGLFALGIGLGFSRGPELSRAPLDYFTGAAFLSGLGGLSLFFVASWSIRFRTLYKGELVEKVGEQAALVDVLRRADLVTLKAFVSSTLPVFFLAAFVACGAGFFCGRYAARRRRDTPTFRPLLFGLFVGSAVFILLAPWVSVVRLGLGAGGAMLGCGCFEPARGAERVRSVGALAALLLMLALSGPLETAIDLNFFYEGPETRVSARGESERYAIALVDAHPGETTLYLNRTLQFTYRDADAQTGLAVDNHHNTLVHPVLALHPDPKSVLILGGGDGQTAREVLRHAGVNRIVDVVADARWLHFARTQPRMRAMNAGALDNPKVHLVVADPLRFADGRAAERFDVIVKDFPPAGGEEVARALSEEYFVNVRRLLKPGGIFSLHSDSYASASFWTIVRTLQAAGFTHVSTLNDNFESSDATEGIIYASLYPLSFKRLNADPITRDLVQRHVLPPPRGLAHNSDPRFISYQVAASHALPNRLAQLTFLSRARSENGFFLPLEFPVGVY